MARISYCPFRPGGAPLAWIWVLLLGVAHPAPLRGTPTPHGPRWSLEGHLSSPAGPDTLDRLNAPAPSHPHQDTLGAPVVRLDEMVVVGNRTGSLLREAVAATTLLTRDDITALPVQSLPELLRSVPGLVWVDRDGSGRLPMAVVRGFFGGGETSYVLLTLDGVPVNDNRTGLVEWTQIPLSDVERVEVLRGSASVMYGDAALGAVVNVVTRDAQARPDRSLSLWTGSWDARGLEGALTRPVAAGWLRTSVALDAEDGFRAHSRSSRASGSISFTRSSDDERNRGFARFSFSRIENQEPGPLPPEDRAQGPVQSLPMFSGDERTRSVADLVAGGSRTWSGARRLDGTFRLRWYEQDWTRTLLLAPSFGNTQRLADESVGAWGRAQYSASLGIADARFGVEGEAAGYGTRYRSPDDGAVLSRGEGRNLKLAAHGEITRELVSRVNLHAGLRYDLVRPQDTGDSPTKSSFSQWSPRLALNVAYARTPSAEGNLFLTWTRAFKAPTLDQLFDVRAIPTGEPGQSVTFANAGLEPQRSSAVEFGVYQELPLGHPGRFAELSATVYRQWLDDEIDFDLRTFQYGNIQRSRHTGLEASVRAVLSPALQLAHAATLTRATFRSSDLTGNQLKNIPRTSFVTTVQTTLPRSFAVTVTHRVKGDVYLDDENTAELPGTSLVDAALTWTRGALRATVTAQNLFDVRFDTFGYLLYDPFQQTEVRMMHPGGGRGLTLRLTLREGGSP